MKRSKLVLNRSYTLISTKGYAVRFEKGKPVHVPPPVYAEAIAIGAQPEDGSDPNVLDDEVKDTAPTDSVERLAKVSEAIEKLVARNAREDFTAAGAPSVRAVSQEAGFRVDVREISAAWQARHDRLAA